MTEYRLVAPEELLPMMFEKRSVSMYILTNRDAPLKRICLYYLCIRFAWPEGLTELSMAAKAPVVRASHSSSVAI